MTSASPAKIRLGIYERYRFVHSDGTSKDWAITIIDGAVDTRFGKTGAALTGAAVEQRFADCNDEVKRRVDEKIRKGYRFVDTVIVYDDGTVEPTQASMAAKPEKREEVDKVYFEIRLHTSDAWQEFLAHCQDACQIMSKTGIESQCAVADQSNARITVSDWPLHLAARATGQRNTLSVSTLDGAGHVHKNEGVYPLLFLMYLKRLASERTYTVELAVKDGIEVTEKLHHEQDVLALFGVRLDDIRPLAVVLGLAEEDIDLASLGTEESMYF